ISYQPTASCGLASHFDIPSRAQATQRTAAVKQGRATCARAPPSSQAPAKRGPSLESRRTTRASVRQREGDAWACDWVDPTSIVVAQGIRSTLHLRPNAAALEG